MYLLQNTQKGRDLRPYFDFSNFFDNSLLDDLTTKDVNMWEDDKSVHIEVAVPGIKENELDINLDNGMLSIRAVKESTEKEGDSKKKIYISSMKTSYSYSTSLPSNLDLSKVQAELENGVLSISIEKESKAKPRKIEIKKK